MAIPLKLGNILMSVYGKWETVCRVFSAEKVVNHSAEYPLTGVFTHKISSWCYSCGPSLSKYDFEGKCMLPAGNR